MELNGKVAWVKVEADYDSLHLYEEELPRVAARHGFHYLDRGPLVLKESDVALVGTYVLRGQTEREFPDARPGTATQKLRERFSSMRGRRAGARAVAAADTIPEQLRQLADLRDHGAISDGDYEAAKTQLLHS